MRGDAEYSNKHQHGIRTEGKAASGAHLMAPSLIGLKSKLISQTSSSFRGHLKLTFDDGSEFTVERGQYDIANPPKVGEYFPPLPAVPEVVNEPAPESAEADSAPIQEASDDSAGNAVSADAGANGGGTGDDAEAEKTA